MNLSDEERERRRQNALALKEKGLIGPQFGKLGGRPRKPRANTTVAEKTAEKGDAIFSRLMSIVEDGMDSQSIKAAQTLLKTEELERQIQEKEVLNIEQAKRDELLEIVAGGLQELQDTGILPGFIDGWAIEVTDAEFERVSESPTSS